MSDYQSAWRRYRFWRNLAILAYVGFIPVMLFAQFLAGTIFKSSTLFGIIILAWFLLALSAGAEWSYWRCPRCGKTFSATWWYHLGPFARRCVHCGLPKYSNG